MSLKSDFYCSNRLIVSERYDIQGINMIITSKWLDDHKTATGGYTKRQLEILGQDWPPEKGWKKKVTGWEISKSTKQHFENAKYIKAGRVDKTKIKKPYFVYFMQSGDKGPIKIGFAANPNKRMADLQTGNPYRLKIIAAMRCESLAEAEYLERKLHKRFKKHRIRGEWFHHSINLKKAVDDVNNQITTAIDQAVEDQRRYEIGIVYEFK